MSYVLRPHPPQPSQALESLSDAERAISGGPLWNLQTIQAKLVSVESMRVIYSSNAENDAQSELLWTIDNAKAFISVLSRARYLASEWCYRCNSQKAYAADAYVMGFNRHKGEENQLTDPWVYFKFSVIEKTHSILILSSHLERRKQ